MIYVVLSGLCTYAHLSLGLTPRLPGISSHGLLCSPRMGTKLRHRDDNASHVWDVISGLAIVDPLGGIDIVRCTAFSANGRRVISRDMTMECWLVEEVLPC